MLKLLIPLLLSLSLNCFSQQIVKGRLLSASENQAIPYANIGITNSPVGTLSNEDGTFKVSIPTKYHSDTLIFSALGYEKQIVLVRSLLDKNETTITMTEKVATLQEVVVTGEKKKHKTFELGNKYNKGGFLYADSISAGAAMALLIENKYPSYHQELKPPYFLEEAQIFISKNTVNDFKLRLRILERNPISGEPAADLFIENIIVSSSIKKGWIKLDLRSYQFVIDKPFYLVIEWIMNEKDRLVLLQEYAAYRQANPDKVKADSTVVEGVKIGFWNYQGFDPGTHLGVSPIPFSLQNYTSYYRTHSFDKWKRAPVVLTARMLVSPMLETSENINPTPEKHTDLQADEMCRQFLSENNVHGLQVAVMQEGKIKFTQSYGFADVTKQIRTTRHTKFRIGSISKAVSSAAILQLQKDYGFDVDKPIHHYLPSIPKQYHLTTTRQLAGHLAGLRHYRENDINDLIRNEHYSSAIDALEIIKDDTLLFLPGTQYHYSSYGWNIIGALIESISKQSYLDFMNRLVFEPLKMNHTQGATESNLSTECSKAYLSTGEEFGEEDFSYKYPSGGLLSTSEDLVVFGHSLLQAKSDALTIQLFESMKLPNGVSTNYGIGWNISKDFNGHRMFFHSGNLLNGSGYLIIYPDDDLVVAFLANSPDGLSFDIQKLASLYYKIEP